MILICYDGSSDAQAAIEHAGAILTAEPATVITVWETVERLIEQAPAIAPVSHPRAMDTARRAEADDQASEGAELARARGFKATSYICEQQTTIADAILNEAERLNAAAIVMGSRGKSLLKSLVLGSTAQDVIQSADRMVMIVPSQEVADSRTQKRHNRGGSG